MDLTPTNEDAPGGPVSEASPAPRTPPATSSVADSTADSVPDPSTDPSTDPRTDSTTGSSASGSVAAPAPGGAASSSNRVALAKALAVYTLLRLGLIGVITLVLMWVMPVIIALLFAVVVQLPLSWVLFGKYRRRVNQAMAVATSKRRAERDRLRAELSGDEPAE